jgi:hypothetical protein
MPAALLRAVFHRPPLGYKMERKNRLKNVAPDDKAAKALLNGRLIDGDFAAWKAKTVTTVQRIEDNHFPVAMTVFQTADSSCKTQSELLRGVVRCSEVFSVAAVC